MERGVYQRLDQLEGEHWWFCVRRQILKSAIARFAPHKDTLRLLEAGCGTGGNLEMLSEFGSVEAFEIDGEARELARRKLSIDVRSGMLPDGIPFTAESFDIVAAFDVIEHVESDVESLRALRQMLVPGGRLVMSVPAQPWMWSQHDITHHHFRRYTRNGLEENLKRAGLKPVFIGHFNTLLFPAIAAIRLVKKGFSLNEQGDDAMPPRAVNVALKWIFGLERGFAAKIALPFGVSLLAVAERAP